MTTLISTIINSSEHTFSILYVQLMLIFICASFAYVYWAETLSYRCLDLTTGVFNEATATGRFTSLENVCYGGPVASGETRTGCADTEICAKYDHNP
jgi:hypothetical protein